jgi:hypothetical protein
MARSEVIIYNRMRITAKKSGLTNEVTELQCSAQLGQEGFVISFELLGAAIIFLVAE